MPNTYNCIVSSVCARIYLIKKLCLVIFEVSPERICAKICDLHHTRQLTVNKKRRFDNTINLCPQRAICKILLHKFCMFLGNCEIVVMNEQTEI